ncbi:MAG: DUF2282 domain-containing protein [Alphaproteobacteria bacterium]
MNRTLATVLASAAGLALAMQAASAGNMGSTNNANAAAEKPKYEKCYGIAAAGKNDCAAGAHSCAGQSTQARDPNSYLEVPVGLCAKIAGGKLTPG